MGVNYDVVDCTVGKTLANVNNVPEEGSQEDLQSQRCGGTSERWEAVTLPSAS